MGFKPEILLSQNDLKVSDLEYCIYRFAEALAHGRQADFQPLSKNTFPRNEGDSKVKGFSELLVVAYLTFKYSK